MGALGWILSLGGTATFIGYVALLIFNPAAALVIEKVALFVLKWITATRLGCAALALSIGLLAGDFYGDHEGAGRVQAEWDAAEHSAIEEGTEARAEAEKEIPPVPAESETPPAAPAPIKFRFLHILRPANGCPPVPTCSAARPAGPVPGWMRNDPHNRDHD